MHGYLINLLKPIDARMHQLTGPALLAICARNSPVTSELSAQMASNAGKVSIWWHHNVIFFHENAFEMYSAKCWATCSGFKMEEYHNA